jgi:hypothetical protein
MPCKGVKQTVKGSLNSASKLVRPHDKDTLFHGCSSSESRWSQLLRHVPPELQGKRIAFQRNSVSNGPTSNIYLHSISNFFIYLMTCEILQDEDDSESDEDAGAAQHVAEASADPWSAEGPSAPESEDPSAPESESAEDHD